MTAAQAKQHQDEKHSRISKYLVKNKKSRKHGKKQEHRTQGVHSNKASRLCYKADPGTLSHYLPYSSRSR